MLKYCLTFCLLCLIAATITAQQTLTVDDRTYIVHAPEEPTGLIIALHPFASSGKAFAAMTQLHATANDAGFAVVYPDAVSFYWDDGRVAEGSTLDVPHGDDIAFLSALIAEVTTDYAIDPANVHLVGMGSGGTMVFRAACEMADQLDSVAVVAALMWNYQEAAACTGEPIDILVMHGSVDQLYRPGGNNQFGGENYTLDVSDTMTYWVEHNGCDPEAIQEISQTPAIFYDECEAETIFFNMLGAGYNWARIEADHILNHFDIDANAILTAFFANERDTMRDAMRIEDPYDGYARTYTLYVPPSYDPETPMPLVMVLHGRPSNSTGMAYISNMNRAAEDYGFIAVYPDSLTLALGWNYVRDVPDLQRNPVDDVQFLKDLVHDIGVDLNVDESRVYATGFSNGGFMTQRLACDASDTFAAFVAVGATGFYGMPNVCANDQSVPMILVHGTADPSVPWQGMQGPLGNSSRVVYFTAPIPETIAFWANFNGCDETFQREDVPPSDDITQLSILRFDNCDEPLTFYGILNGGHNWVGAPVRIGEEIAGNVNFDINVNDVIWDFFSQHTLNR